MDGSWRAVKRKMGLWEEYYGVKEEGYSLMEDAPSDEDRVARVMHFATWLFGVKNMVGKPLTTALGALKTTMEAKGLNVIWWKDDRICRARKAARPTTVEAKTIRDGATRMLTLPMTGSMVLDCRVDLWVEGDWSAEGLDKKARWLVIALGFDSGSRIGQLTLAEKGGEDHTLRARDVTFVMKDGSAWVGDSSFRDILMEQGKAGVQLVDIEKVTGKTSKGRNTSTVNVDTIMRRTPAESQVVDDLCDWVMWSGVKQNDPFFTRYDPLSGSRKVVTRKEVTQEIKGCARRRGMPEGLFCTRSLRKGYATHSKAVGVAREDMLARGAWSDRSTVPETHYISSIGAEGGLATMVTGEEGISRSEITRMAGMSLRSKSVYLKTVGLLEDRDGTRDTLVSP